MSVDSPDWGRLYAEHPRPLVAALKKRYADGSIAYLPRELAQDAFRSGETFSEEQARALLESAGSWLTQQEEEAPPDPEFPDDEPKKIIRFVWSGAPKRPLGWLLLVHGMNTDGAWQELLAFDIGLWQGAAVPTFVHKYGWIIIGVVLPWRRRKFKRELRERLVALSHEARKQRVRGKPDVVAHSFGTWLMGHLLLEEARLGPEDRIEIGRLILTGSILRPDFPWPALQEAGVVEDVLNHYGTEDPIVPLAHWTIWDSGPSGRRGIDIQEQLPAGPYAVINVAAPKGKHSTLLADAKRYASYSKTWKPFLTNPTSEASRSLTISNPTDRWRQAWWPLRGTLLPWIVLPLLSTLLAFGVVALGPSIAVMHEAVAGHILVAARYLAYALGALVGLFILHGAWSATRRR